MKSADPRLLAQVAELAAFAQEQLTGKEFFVSAVLDRVGQARSAFPHDQAFSTLEFMLEKRAKREGSLALISQAELDEIFTDVSSLGNRELFREELGDLLLTSAPEKVVANNEDLMTSRRSGGEELQLTDPSAADALYGLFDEQAVVAAKGGFVDNGRRGLELELESLGFGNPEVQVVARDQNFVIYAAAIDSTHGRISAYVPAEVKLGSVLMPSVFVSGRDFLDLTGQNLRVHAQGVAIGRKSAQPHEILKTLNALAGKQDEIQKAASTDETHIHLTQPELYGQQVDDEVQLLETPKVAMPKELEHFTEGQMREILAEAGLSYDASLVSAVKLTVATELRTMGLQFGKVVIASEFPGGLLVAANIVGKGGTKTIEVPVEIVNGQVLAPSVFTSGPIAQPFDQASLRAFATGENNGQFNAAYSTKVGLSFKDLHGLMLRSAAYGNFVEVEEALAVIAEEYGAELHRVAHEDLLGLLNAGYGEEVSSDATDRYLKEASERARDKENLIHVQSTAALLYPGV